MTYGPTGFNATGGGTIRGSYTGTGSGTKTVTLASACDLVMITGEGGTLTNSVHALGIRGAAHGFKLPFTSTTSLGSPTSDTNNPTVASDGLSFTCAGTGGEGMNNSGATYHYVAVIGS